MLSLLKLHPKVIDIVADLGDALPSRIVTERKLRPLTKLSGAEQLAGVKEMILG